MGFRSIFMDILLLYCNNSNYFSNLIGAGIVEMELRCTQSTHYCIEDTELSSGKSSNHDTTGNKSNSTKVDESNLLSNIGNTLDHGSISSCSLLVDLGKKGISGVGDNSGSNSSNNTGTKRNRKVSNNKVVRYINNRSLYALARQTMFIILLRVFGTTCKRRCRR